MKLSANFLKSLNSSPKDTSDLALVRKRWSVKITSMSLALLTVLGLTACSQKQTSSEATTVSQEQTASETPEVKPTEGVVANLMLEETLPKETVSEETVSETEPLELLADRLDISGLVMTDGLTNKVHTDTAQQSGTSNSSETTNNHSDVYVADGSVWVSEDAYNSYVGNGGSTTTYDDGYYHAPDGSVWSSEQMYLDYINGMNSATGTGDELIVEATQNTESEILTESIPKDSNSLYRDEYGNWWASYEDYLAYKQSETELTR